MTHPAACNGNVRASAPNSVKKIKTDKNYNFKQNIYAQSRWKAKAAENTSEHEKLA